MNEQVNDHLISIITRWASVGGVTGVLRKLLVALVGNTIIAVLISVLLGHFWINFTMSQCIGLSVFTLSLLAQKILKSDSPHPTLPGYIFAIVGGTVLGVIIAYPIVTRIFYHGVVPKDIGTSYVPIYLGLFFGAISAYIHYSRREIEQTLEKLRAEENARIKQEKQLAEAQLKLIQAQIEPHFLFNTLATISSLILKEPETAQFMLEQLNQYLRTSLSRTRNGQMSLRHEIELLSAYLAIIKIRMHDRLSFNIDVDEKAQEVFIPALLLQPIVENAIKHGLEPKVEGGKINIRCRIVNDRLIIEINDSGIGEKADWKQGTGLSNVRERVNTFYHNQGKFSLTCNQSGSSALFDLPVTAQMESA